MTKVRSIHAIKLMKNKFLFLEKLIYIEAFLLISSLLIISLVFCWQTLFFSEKKEEALEKHFLISCEGAIQKDIILEFSRPVSFKKILSIIEPKVNADVSIYPKNKKIAQSVSFYFFEKKEKKKKNKLVRIISL